MLNRRHLRAQEQAAIKSGSNRLSCVHDVRRRTESVHPGVIETDIGDQTFVSRARNLGTNDVEAARRLSLSTHPIGRLGMPDDIAKGIGFLASDDSAFMTGVGLVVDGGLTAW